MSIMPTNPIIGGIICENTITNEFAIRSLLKLILLLKDKFGN